MFLQNKPLEDDIRPGDPVRVYFAIMTMIVHYLLLYMHSQICLFYADNQGFIFRTCFELQVFCNLFHQCPPKHRITSVETLLFTFQSSHCFYFCLWRMLELLFRWEMDFSLVFKQSFSTNQIGSGETHWRKIANKIGLYFLSVLW